MGVITLEKRKGFIFLILLTCAFLICGIKVEAYNFGECYEWHLAEYETHLLFPSFYDAYGADTAFKTNYRQISTRERDGLKGPVKQIKYGEVRERSMGKLIINEDKLDWEVRYNEEGQKTYDGYKYYYENGRVIERRSGNPPPEGQSRSECEQWKFTYNDKGQIVFVKFIDYDDEDSEEEPTWAYQYTYDDKGRLKERKDKIWGYNNIFLYDNKGRISKIYEQNKSGIDTGLDEFKYDANGLLYTPSTKFNKHGRITFHESKPLGVKETDAYEYDSKGYLVKHINKRYSTTTIKTYNYYKFDSKGNWIEREVIQNGKFDVVEARVIHYYE